MILPDKIVLFLVFGEALSRHFAEPTGRSREEDSYTSAVVKISDVDG